MQFGLVYCSAVYSGYLSSSLIYEEPVPPGPALAVPHYAVLQLAVHPGVTVPRLHRVLHTAQQVQVGKAGVTNFRPLDCLYLLTIIVCYTC